MGAQGKTTIDFGAHPGAADASVTVTGQSGILAASSLAEAWLFPEATANHSIDEHVVDGPMVFACEIVDGVGFTIRATARNPGNLYGLYSVGWVWN